MDPERWTHAKQLFEACLGVSPTEVRALLERECGDDLELRAEVESLLSADRVAEARGDDLAASVAAARESLAVAPDLEGSQLGAYRVLRRIGEGGMGVVYLAERADGQFNRRVAVKLIRPECTTPSLLERFARERRTLAALEHPGIARLLDAGTSEHGLPYLVMEYVAGIPIDRYCATQKLDLAARVRLFLGVCDAVEHAHRNLVVHRDLKPGNILVSADGVAKLLDFGVAGLVPGGPEAPTMELTRPADRILTPAYASPEQLRGQVVTTASDVYSLGLVLGELLNGVPAAAAGGGRMRREVAQIVAKAAADDPGERYSSAERLSDDLRRLLDGRPVLACGPGLGYRARKLLYRRWPLAAALTLALVSLAVAVVGTGRAAAVAARERDRARLEAAKASQVTRFLQEMLESVDPRVGRRDLSVADVLDRASREIDRLAARPEVEAAIRTTIGRSDLGLGRYAEAIPHLECALELVAAAAGPADPRTGQAHAELAAGLHESGDLDRAEEEFRAALAILDRPEQPRPAALAAVLAGHAVLQRQLGQLDDAEVSQRRALELYRTLPGEWSAETATALNNLGVICEARSQAAEAEELYRRAVDLSRRAYPADHPDLAHGLSSLAGLLAASGRFGEAEPLFRESLAIREVALGAGHPLTAATQVELADALRAAGRPAEAAALARRGLAVAQDVLPPDHPLVARALFVSGLVALDSGETAIAEPLLRQAVAIRRAGLPAGHWLTASAECALGRCLLAAQRAADAGPLIEHSLAILRRRPGPDSEVTRACEQGAVALAAAGGR